MSLELAWGKLRRALIRLFRPGYVRAMEQKRRGHCRCNPPHDIIDSRDLKYYRNLCDCSFDEADDPFRWRDRLPFARAGLAELVFFSLVHLALIGLFTFFALSAHSLFWIGTAVFTLLWLFVLSFFRDPERAIPEDPMALVSPADGTITHIDEVEEPDFPGGRAFRISIFLSVFNVHVNRIPIAGRALGARYFPGKFLDARTTECARLNEQLWIDLAREEAGQWVRIKQISGAVARRIVCWLRAGEKVEKGARLGMIKFGSRTEIYLPVETAKEVLVKVGDSVRGGSTVLLRYLPSSA